MLYKIISKFFVYIDEAVDRGLQERGHTLPAGGATGDHKPRGKIQCSLLWIRNFCLDPDPEI